MTKPPTRSSSICCCGRRSTIVRSARPAIVFTYAFDSEYVSSNIMQRYPKMQRVEGERTANRGVFSEVELQAIFENATPFELALTGCAEAARDRRRPSRPQ